MKISGKLSAKDAGPLNGVNVQILDDGGEISKARSNPQGKFECPVADAFADRPLRLLAQPTGYHPLQKEIQCASDTDLGDLILTAVVAASPPPPPPPPNPPPPVLTDPHPGWPKLLLKTGGTLLLMVFEAVVVLGFLLTLALVLFGKLRGDNFTKCALFLVIFGMLLGFRVYRRVFRRK